MLESHYAALVVSYAVALAGWFALNKLFSDLWPAGSRPFFSHPWRETGLALVSVVGVLLVGQLYVQRLLLPEAGPAGPMLAAVNQVLIFSPVILLLVLRRDPPSSAWIDPRRAPARIGAGILLASLALLVYALTRVGADSFFAMAARLPRYQHIDEAVQVLLEDITIAVLFVRISAAIGTNRAILLVALLFAAGHIPALIAGGATASELLSLLRDAALGVAVIAVLQHSRDVLWFWCVHFVMDMMQYESVSGGL